MNRLTYFIILTHIFIFSGCADDSSSVRFPNKIFLEEPSPDKEIKAIIFTWNENGGTDLLGSSSRFVLGFKKGETKWFLEKEISEGRGTYEGGITGLKWLNNHEVLINRILDDQPNNLIYNLRDHAWRTSDEQ
jgi:hypothetical protein